MTKPHTTLSEAVRALMKNLPPHVVEHSDAKMGYSAAIDDVLNLVEQHEAQEPVPEGWQVTHMPPWGAMTDAAQAAQRISVQRLVAPFCDKAGLRVWCGPTLEAAMQTAHAALKLPYKPAATDLVSQPTLAATQAGDAKDAARWRFMMAVADNNQGPEAMMMEELGNKITDDDEAESAGMERLVDAAIAAMSPTTTRSE